MIYKFLVIFIGVFSVFNIIEANDYLKHADSLNIIIDTDCDVDDMMAILYLVNDPKVNIAAITTVGNGLTHWEYGAINVLNLLELAGDPKIPVAYGAKSSLSPVGYFPAQWREKDDSVMGIKLPNSNASTTTLSSHALMTQIIKKSPVKVTLICLGPLTNIALALKKTPEIKENIDRIYFMGGTLLVPGNVVGHPQGFSNRVAEYNVFLDAKATQVVFESGIPITLVPLDATQYVPMTNDFYEKISTVRKTASANFVYEVVKPYVGKGRKRMRRYFWDPLTAVIMTHPEVGTYRDLKLTINRKKGPEYGRLMMSKSGPTIRVVTGIHSEEFYDLFLKTLNNSKY